MSREEGFLQAIIEEPDDVGLRLIYADWLEERGDPRGEFIRVQCQLEDLDENDSRFDELKTRERELLASGREIRDLMGARNLHIIDVFDVDGTGKSAKAFGRVFYTEGKSLIFYAFDLTSRRHPRADHAFQAWGYRDPAPQSARSLGIFYADDKTQNRWVLKFDDPQVLAEIDSVYVTVEPPGGSPKPTGQKLLYAYLNGQPNHP